HRSARRPRGRRAARGVAGGAPRRSAPSQPERRRRRGRLRGRPRPPSRRPHRVRPRRRGPSGARRRPAAAPRRRRTRRGPVPPRHDRSGRRDGDRGAPVSLRLHGDALAEPGLLDFAVNTWPAERSAGLEAALRRALSSGGYPSDRRARALVAARHGRDAAEVLAANGACDVFWLLAHALRPKRACCIHPSFTEPEAALRAVGADVVHVLREPETWSFDPAQVPDDAELVVVGNPNNPTGGLDPRDAILALVRPGRLVLVDESFMDFVPGEPESLAA